MKKGLMLFVAAVVIIGGRIMGKYNGMVNMDEGVKEAWAQVENQYQRRSDLIPMLVETVKGVAGFEKDTYTQVTQARAQASQTKVDINDAESFAKFQANQGELSSALSRLMMTVEAYPELKANENFMELQSQLEGTENRISVERKRFNEVVKVYNVFIRSFPNNFIANMFGFDKAEMFASEEGADKAVDIDFSEKKTESEEAVSNLGNKIEAKKMEIELEKLNNQLEDMKGEVDGGGTVNDE